MTELQRIITVGEITYDQSKELRPDTNIFKGSFGIRKNVAIKRIFCDEIHIRQKEFERWVECDNQENVLKYYGAVSNDCFIYIASELCLGNLKEWMKNEITEIQFGAIATQEILHQIAKGLANLHSKRIIHRNLKPTNILLNRDNTGNIYAKIADFEVSRQILEGKTSKIVTSGPDDETKGWQAPEILLAQTNNTNIKEAYATDIFSLGCIFYYVITKGTHPFGDDADCRNFYIKNGITAVNDKHFTRLQVGNLSLLQNMITKNRIQRPTLDYILPHHIFWSHQRMLDFVSLVCRLFETPNSDEINAVKDKLYSDTSIAPKRCSNYPDGWLSLPCQVVQDYLKNNPFCSYSRDNRVDIYRAVYNLYKHGHHGETPQTVRDALAPDHISYWLQRFPLLISRLWLACRTLRLSDDPFKVNSYY